MTGMREFQTGATPTSGTVFDGVSGYVIIFALLVVSYALCAAQRATDPSPWAFLVILVTVAVVFRVTGTPPMIQHVAWVILSAAGLATIITALSSAGGHVLDIVFSTATMVALLVAPVAIIGHQVKRRGLNLEALLAAITAYVFVGLFFTFAFNLLSLVSPASIFDGTDDDSLANQLFFSFTTLTTTGYGNLVPSTATSQAVAVAEAITGQLFLITAVARIMRGAGARAGVAAPSSEESP
ncbi:two pore domain potassium channel family protein [Microbacterium sp. CBA3102]|uniref:ion channel n=1 Tax=Microbacterium sp. CBA3102 TaxID=2603598 RepID=UPI0011BB144F|nr:ion channel [Microbacterium sp. CBA3102]QEA28471.1 two pore domain potassium channel family protein [Microbacterium sp. CBA3102]